MNIKWGLLCGLCWLGATAVYGQTSPADKQLEDYFVKVIKQEKTALPADKTLSTRRADEMRQRVWRSWQAAVKAAESEPLISLTPLAAADTGRWHIPSALEPHASMPYYYGSKGDRPSSGYPLFIYLHGSGPKTHEWATGLKLAQMFDDGPSAYFVPQIPNEGEYYRWGQPGKQYLYARLLRQVLAGTAVDPRRIYLFGISEGGYGSQRMASFYADYLAGAGPMAGGEPQPNAPAENLANIAFSLVTGENDNGFYRRRFTLYTGEVLDSLSRLHPGLYTHRVALQAGRGHGIDYTVTTPYLKQFVRSPYPKYVCWENFEMYGPHRSGFYNLRLPDAVATDGPRIRYEMKIDGNNVGLRVDTVAYTVTEKDPRWGFPMRVSKSYKPVGSGHLQVFLNDSLVDLRKPVSVRVNGKKVFRVRVKPSLRAMVLSTQEYFDPLRVFPAVVDVKW